MDDEGHCPPPDHKAAGAARPALDRLPDTRRCAGAGWIAVLATPAGRLRNPPRPAPVPQAESQGSPRAQRGKARRSAHVVPPVRSWTHVTVPASSRFSGGGLGHGQAAARPRSAWGRLQPTHWPSPGPLRCAPIAWRGSRVAFALPPPRRSSTRPLAQSRATGGAHLVTGFGCCNRPARQLQQPVALQARHGRQSRSKGAGCQPLLRVCSSSATGVGGLKRWPARLQKHPAGERREARGLMARRKSASAPSRRSRPSRWRVRRKEQLRGQQANEARRALD